MKEIRNELKRKLKKICEKFYQCLREFLKKP